MVDVEYARPVFSPCFLQSQPHQPVVRYEFPTVHFGLCGFPDEIRREVDPRICCDVDCSWRSRWFRRLCRFVRCGRLLRRPRSRRCWPRWGGRRRFCTARASRRLDARRGFRATTKSVLERRDFGGQHGFVNTCSKLLLPCRPKKICPCIIFHPVEIAQHTLVCLGDSFKYKGLSVSQRYPAISVRLPRFASIIDFSFP